MLLVLLYLPCFAQHTDKVSLTEHIHTFCPDCESHLSNTTGAYILEFGEESLISRAWLAAHAAKTIDVQYFIWSSDNIGILATEALLSAAERGVKVRVLVDDLLVDADEVALLALDSHSNIEIKIYNPMHSVGVSGVERAVNVVTNFHGVNQRMHDKTAIFDGVVGITGGRNMADEYFDYNQEYNFRDRDILLLGKAVGDMSLNFEEFWVSDLAVSVRDILAASAATLTQKEVDDYRKGLHDYALNEDNFEPNVRRAINEVPDIFPELIEDLVWDEVKFISDKPGKNTSGEFLGGGGQSTEFLTREIKKAKHRVLIQSPYLVLPEGGLALFKRLVEAGVRVQIVTNSLASTDNLMAFSGYYKQRKRIIESGVELYEFKPQPGIQRELVTRYPVLADKSPIFAIHAKSMVIDDEKIYIGTFNLDPRSANLNTEVGVFIENKYLGEQLTASIENDASPDNSWKITADFTPDSEVGFFKRVKLFWYSLLPMNKVL